MKYSILGFSQNEVLKCRTIINVNGKEKEVCVDVTDLLILQCVADFLNRQHIYKYVINDKMFFPVQYNMLVEDLPILNMGKQALRDRIDKLVLFDLLEKEVIKNDQGSYAVFRIGKRYEQLKYNNNMCMCENTGEGVYQTTHGCVSNYTPKNTTTIHNKEKEDNKLSSKKKLSNGFVVPTTEEVSAYIEEKGYHFDAECFISFYESKGWMIGKNLMVSWKHACSTWEKKIAIESPTLFSNLDQQQRNGDNLEINGQLYR